MIDLISQSVIFIPFILYILLIFTKNNKRIYLLGIFGFFLTLILSDLLKNYVFQRNIRPKGAFNCNILNDDGNQEGKPGYPSGHVSTTSFFVFFLIYIIWSKTSLNKSLKYLLSVLLFLYLILIAFTRFNKRCHTINQIIGGTIFGLVILIFISNISHCLKPKI